MGMVGGDDTDVVWELAITFRLAGLTIIIHYRLDLYEITFPPQRPI